MFCERCGKEVPDKINFCPFCGTQQREEIVPLNDRADAGENAASADSSVPDESKDANNLNTLGGSSERQESAKAKKKAAKKKATKDLPQIIKKMKNPLPKIILAVVVVGAVVTGAILGSRYVKEQKQERYDTEMRHARRYLNDLKYEQAIVAYQAAIKIDPKNPKPYIGIADAYIAMGDYDSAHDFLQDGYDLTGDKKLRDYLEKVENDLKSRTKVRGMVIQEGPDGEGSNATVIGASVHLEKNMGTPFKADTKTDENGMYEFSDLRPGRYNLEITADDYLKVEQVIDVYPGQTESYNPVIRMISDTMAGEGTASGFIIDAVTGYGVEGLTLKLRDGYNNTRGSVLTEAKTDINGYYTTPLLKAGYYTIEIVDQRSGIEVPFLRSYISVRVLGGKDTEGQNGSVSTKLNEGQLRIVLSWGSTPLDLDSHLFCLFENGDTHMNYFDNRVYADNETGERIVDLDLDDTDAYGPETTTIYVNRDGDYIFGIYDYSHGSEEELKNSHAVVQVYLGNTAIPTYVFYVPQENGYFWEVFRYDSRSESITHVNKIYENYWDRDYFYQGMY